MKRLVLILSLTLGLMAGANLCHAQGYVKLNTAYAIVGVINPQVEFRLTPHSAFQTEVVYSPWHSVKGHPMHFGIFMNEYRYFIGHKPSGFYIGANGGLMAFKMSKPDISSLKLQNRYCKGWGFMFGAVVGYEYHFAKRWILDVFAGFGYMHSHYNGYSMDGVVDMHPHRPAWKEPSSPDPYNISAEWLPNKIGISIGFLIFDRK